MGLFDWLVGTPLQRGIQAYSESNYSNAAQYLYPLAEQGNAEAQCYLGRAYRDSEDYAAGEFWLTEAAKQGHTDAQFELGLLYDGGEGLLEDNQKQMFWYRKAAEQGHSGAQVNLGNLYYHGKGVPEDNIQAYAWFNLADAQGNEIASNNKRDALRFMTTDEVAEAQALSRKILEDISRQNSSGN